MAEKRGGKTTTFDKMSPEMRAEMGRRGGTKRAENFKRRKALKETLEIFLQMPVRKGKVTDCESVRAFAELKGKNVTVDQALMVTLVNKALRGDLNAMSMLISMIGEKPSENLVVDAMISKNPLQDLSTDELRKLIKDNDTD